MLLVGFQGGSGGGGGGGGGASGAITVDPNIIGRGVLTAYNAVPNTLVRYDSGAGQPSTITLPNAPALGTVVYVTDIGDLASEFPVTIQGQGTDFVMDPALLTYETQSVQIKYNGVTQGFWYNQDPTYGNAWFAF